MEVFLGGPGISGDLVKGCLIPGPVKRSCRELLYRDVSYGGPVKRSCREL